MTAKGDEYWWATLDILAGSEQNKPQKDIMADVEDWLNKITAKIAKQRRLALEIHKTVLTANHLEKPHRFEDCENKTIFDDLKKPKFTPLKHDALEYKYFQTSFGDHIEIEVSFNNPRIRSRLEKLMGTNVVRITDRKYMIKLQERIKEDHLENQKKRIQEREAEEVEREKKLILEGKIPIEKAPKELKNHPVCKINQITKKIFEEKKAKTKHPPRASSSKSGGKKMKNSEDKTDQEFKQDNPAGEPVIKEGAISTQDFNDITKEQEPPESVSDLLRVKNEYEKLKYEAPLVKVLKEVKSVEDMYKLAEEIVGPLKHQKTSK